MQANTTNPNPANEYHEERLPTAVLLRLYDALEEQHRYAFVTSALSDVAFDDLASALKRRRRPLPQPPPTTPA